MSIRLDELHERYADARLELENIDWSDDFDEWVGGDLAMQLFGRDVTELDAICMLADVRPSLDLEIQDRVAIAREAGYSWNAIAAALGTSRQAARQRYGPKKPDSGAVDDDPYEGE